MLFMQCFRVCKKKKNTKTVDVADPYRSKSGKTDDTGATELMEVLGKEESISRIKAAIEKIRGKEL